LARFDQFSDRIESLRENERDLLEEVARLRREEEYLRLKVRQAREQVHYYEGLLTLLRHDFGRPPSLAEVVRRLG
jgi:predicted RNase H-like nuclease (RuvC/YqgF family)